MPTPLDRIVAVDVRGVTVRQALDQLRASTDVPFNFDADVVNALPSRITFRDSRTTLGRALAFILRGTGLAATAFKDEIVVARSTPATVSGRVTDSRTGAGVLHATVSLDGLWHRAVSSDSGAYDLDSVPAGTYTLTIHALGFRPGTRSVHVESERSTALDIPIEPFTSTLDRVVVTGTVAPTAEKALPTPISVITAEQIQQRHYTRVGDIFRGDVPGSVAWDQGNLDYYSTITVRGINSLDVNNIKTYVDGVEVADPAFAAVDVNSIEHIEVIRGPEASTIYGSDASGGVMQIFTNHGRGAPDHPTVNASIAEGIVQSPVKSAGALQQQYALSVAGSHDDASYNAAVSYRHVGAWIPGYYSSDPGAYGGMHIGHQSLSIDLSGRYFQRDLPSVISPVLVATGIPQLSLPQNIAQAEKEQTLGVQLKYTPTAWWQNSLTVGYDRFDFQYAQTVPLPPDSGLALFDRAVGKASISYNTFATFAMGPAVRSTVTLGFDHYDRTVNEVVATGLPAVIGNVFSNAALVDRDPVNNTGLFGQVQLGAWDALFLTAGIRGDHNSGIGPMYGEAIAPRIGVSFVRTLGDIAVKARAAFGEGIQPGMPSDRIGHNIAGHNQLPNDNLGPERQIGGDGGIDFVFGRLASLSVTYYDQQARDLIDDVPLNTQSTPPSFQFQNVGRIDNRGLEVEGCITTSRLTVGGEFSYTASRIAHLSPTYTGDYRVGDQAQLVPLTSAGLTVTAFPWHGGSVTGGGVYVGHWTSYNYVRLDSALYAGAPLRPLRDYWMTFPAFVKLRLSIDQRLGPHSSVFVSIDNLANTHPTEQYATFATPGRTTTLGLRIRY